MHLQLFYLAFHLGSTQPSTEPQPVNGVTIRRSKGRIKKRDSRPNQDPGPRPDLYSGHKTVYKIVVGKREWCSEAGRVVKLRRRVSDRQWEESRGVFVTGVNGLGSRQQKIYISCNNMQSAYGYKVRVRESSLNGSTGMVPHLTL